MKRKSKVKTKEPFGKRLARIRKAKGFTQQMLADAIGVSQRVIAYYEKETNHLPANYLPPIANALGVSLDELMGMKELKGDLAIKDPKLWKKLRKIEKLSEDDQKIIIHMVDSLASKK